MANFFLKKLIFKLTPNSLIKLFQSPNFGLDPFADLSYSQEGEDLILKRIFEGKKNGFYVDVGAHHPKRFSNTYIFYKMGWRGINIDAMPGSMNEFNKYRPDDINLEYGISDTEQEAMYYMFNEPALNTFSKEQAELKNGLKNFKITQTIPVKLIPLSTILNKYVSNIQNIDFLNIDVEAFDFKVLKSIDFTFFKPSIILIEDSNFSFKDERKSNINNHLKKNGYVLYAKTFNTLIFRKEN